VGNLRIEAFALEGIAGIYAAQRRDQLALKQYQELETFFTRIHDLRGRTTALNAHGKFLLLLGERQKALDLFSEALSLSEKMGDRGTLISTLYNLARTNESLGLHEVALSLIKRSFNLIEQIRADVESPDFRASYFSAVRPHYDLFIEILMQLHRLRPDRGFAAEAFSVSEQSRARLLLDLLSESRTNMRAGAARDLVENDRRLRDLLRARGQYQLNLSLSRKRSAELTDVTDQIARLRTEYQTVQAQLRAQNPRLFSFEKFVPMDLKRIQKELSGSNTMLLEYAVIGVRARRRP
jgi:tetratricopeptide (TPR) repeat protein